MVVKLSYTNDTLQHFLVALGSLDESFSLRTKAPGQEHHATSLYAFSLQQYNTGINNILKNGQLQAMPALILASCIAGVLYEMWLGSHENARRHALAASRIQSQLWSSGSTNAINEEANILNGYLKPIIARNNHVFSVYPDALHWRHPPPNKVRASSTGCHGSFAVAKQKFEAMSPELIEQAEAATKSHKGLERAVNIQKLVNRLDQWHDSFVTLPPLQCPNAIREANLLKVKYHGHRIAIGCAPYEDQCIYDRYVGDFKAIVDLCDEFLQSIGQSAKGQVIRTHDNSTALALNVVGCFCRDPEVRRKAIRLLYRYLRLEGVWLSAMMGFFAEMILMVEEKGLPNVTTSADIPAERRARFKNVRYDPRCLAEDTV